MKIIAAPDSFKGSISAQAAARAMKSGILDVLPDAQVVELPLADGGEGTTNNLVAATGGHITHQQVTGPLGRSVKAGYGILGDGKTCVIEIAEASGLPLIRSIDRNPEIASTEGTGELIRHALDAGMREFIIGLGGSATNDGGTGMLRALGMKFLDAQGAPVKPGGGDLRRLAEIDASEFDARIQECRFLIASDVDNPLVGPNGASNVFGPQKGATEEMVERLDDNLRHYADAVERVAGIALHDYPGAGAAGGAGGAFLAFFPAQMRRGIDVVLEASGFLEHVENCDLVLTGEGKSDLQTLSGKTPYGVAELAARYKKPVLLVSGMIASDSRYALEEHFTEVHAVVGESVSQKQSFLHPEKYLRQKTKQVIAAYQKIN
ncbi:glycerate kinase [Planococcus sp. ISL-109]|uniref:glycerate kinase n=1 Tax=Planococcus sp. ISL-109 TaxID=2819166 RepID=UPI001BEBE526|nr:glycerate kinase [Planococcus sp. ISL-109]MBT2583409.1 glycerate kinase [Planococcus sp. ISL-109]